MNAPISVSVRPQRLTEYPPAPWGHRVKRGRYLAAAVAALVGFTTFATGGAHASTPAVPISYDGVAPTFGKAANGAVGEVWPADSQVQYRTLTSGTWSSPTTLATLPGGLTVRSTTAAVGLNYLGNLDVYVVASDGQAWHSYAASGASGWSGFSSLGAPAVPIAGDVAVGTNYLGNQEMYVRTIDGQVFHRFSTPGQGSGWSGWDTMGRPAPGVRGDVAVGKNSLGNQELYIVGNDGRPYHNFSTPGLGSGWNGWDPLDGPIAPLGDVSVGINYVGNQELYLVGVDGTVWHNYATPGSGSGWVGWSPLSAPDGVALTGNAYVQPHDFSVLGQQWIRVITNTGVVWQTTQTPGAGSGWTGWTPPSTPLPPVNTPPPVTAPPAPAPTPTPSQQNAIRSAQSYLKFMHFSRLGLIGQLSSPYGEGFPLADATFAVDSLNVDWNAQAVGSAQDYLKTMGFSCQGLIDQLSSRYGEQLTVEQATYGATQVGLC